jgi:hypothetical protein
MCMCRRTSRDRTHASSKIEVEKKPGRLGDLYNSFSCRANGQNPLIGGRWEKRQDLVSNNNRSGRKPMQADASSLVLSSLLIFQSN